MTDLTDKYYASGAHVEIRDAEWRMKRVDHSSDGGYVLLCEGLSDLVQGREALFSSPAACLSTVHNRMARLQRRLQPSVTTNSVRCTKTLLNGLIWPSLPTGCCALVWPTAA